MDHKIGRDFRDLGHHHEMVYLHPGTVEHLRNDVRIGGEVNIRHWYRFDFIFNIIIYLF